MYFIKMTNDYDLLCEIL